MGKKRKKTFFRGFAEFDDLVKEEHARIDREMAAKMTKVPTDDEEGKKSKVRRDLLSQ